MDSIERLDGAAEAAEGGGFERERNETALERLDRNTTELTSELRVAATGIQVLFGFLLIVPFNTGFRHVSSFDRYLYFASLICVAGAAVLLLAPVVHHRLLFQRRQKEYLLRLGTRFAVGALVLLSVGLTGILTLLGNVVFGTAAAAVVGIGAAAVLGGLWFAMPLIQRRDCPVIQSPPLRTR